MAARSHSMSSELKELVVIEVYSGTECADLRIDMSR